MSFRGEEVESNPIFQRVLGLVQGSAGSRVVELHVAPYRHSSYRGDPGSQLEQPETVIESAVSVNNETFHLPMIDFTTTDKEVAGNYMRMNFRRYPWLLFSSGRSFHGYVGAFMRPSQWFRYMGVLLWNAWDEKKQMIIDARWVGHSLHHGAAHLRITRNNPETYLKIPELIEVGESPENPWQSTVSPAWPPPVEQFLFREPSRRQTD